MGYWCDPGVGGEVACGLGCRPVTDLERDRRLQSTIPMPGIEIFGWGKWVFIEHPLDIGTDGFSLQQRFFQGFGMFRDCDFRGLAVGYCHRLCTECGDDLVGVSSAHAGCVFDRGVGEFAFACLADSVRPAAAGQDFPYSGMADAGPDDPFE